MNGRTLGPYVLSHRLGRGGMGDVWQAHKQCPGAGLKQVALKLLHDDHPNLGELLELFFTEARLAMLVNHPNVVQAFELAEAEDGTHYLVMEWVDGLNLTQLSSRLRARKERLPLDLVAFVIGELLKALICIHELLDRGEPRSIIHRDLTPDNVMLSVWGDVKLMDFGVARLADDESEELYAKGKLPYMPPEQLTDDTCAPTHDLFAVGAILHELLDGEPFRAAFSGRAQLEQAVVEGLVPELRDPARVPAPLDRLRRRLLAPSASSRIPSAREAYIQLRLWPGCHDAQFELERLVRQFAPPGLVRELDESETIEDLSSLHLVTWTDHEPPEPADAPSEALGSSEPARAPARRPWLAAAAGFTLLCAGAGAAFAGHHLLAPPEIFELHEAATSEPNVQPAWAPWRHRAPAPPPPPDPAMLRPVPLEVVAPGYAHIEFVIGEHEFLLANGVQRRKRLLLLPGDHEVLVRTSEEGEFHRAGSFTLAPGSRNRLRIDAQGQLGLWP